MKEIFIGSMDAMNYFLESFGFKVTREYISKEKRYRFVIELNGASCVGFFTYPDKDGLSTDKKSEIMLEFCVRLINSFWSAYLQDITGPIARRHLTADERAYVNNDIASVTTNAHFRYTIEKVIFNDPATIVFWSDGTKTVVKTQNGETFDPEKGLAMAIAKRAFGNKGNYYNHIGKWVDKYNEEQEALRKLRGLFDRFDAGIKSLHDKLSKTLDEKPMTFKEKLQKEHPEEIEDHYFGGCAGCPYDYGYMKNTKKNKACHQFSDTGRFIGLSDETCTKCWNRVIPKDSDA